jgi:hypothetical protein
MSFLALPVSYCRQVLGFKKKAEYSNIVNASFHKQTVHTANFLPQKEVYSRLPSSFVFSRGIFFTPPYLDGKFWIDHDSMFIALWNTSQKTHCLIYEDQLFDRNPLYTPMYV